MDAAMALLSDHPPFLWPAFHFFVRDFARMRHDIIEAPQAKAAAEGGDVMSAARSWRQFLQRFRVAAADDDVIGDERFHEPRDNRRRDRAPFVLAEPSQAAAA